MSLTDNVICNTEIKFGVSLPMQDEISNIITYAINAEKRGFDLVTVADHVFIPHEAFSVLTAIAMNTNQILLGTSVIDSNRRSPAILAHVTATLDQISKGRLILGVGRGVWNEASFGFHLKKPISRMKEIIIVLKKFWTEDKMSYEGNFFKFIDAGIAAKPVQKPYPPIWIAGFGPRMLKITGELGNGFITQNISPELYEREFSTVKESAINSKRDPHKITGIFCAPMIVSSDYNEALRYVEQTVRSALFRHGGPPSNWANFFGYETPWDNPEDIPLEIIDKCCIFGTPDDCIEKIEKYIKNGVNYFIAQSLSKLGLNGLELFTKKIIDYFKDDHNSARNEEVVI